MIRCSLIFAIVILNSPSLAAEQNANTTGTNKQTQADLERVEAFENFKAATRNTMSALDALIQSRKIKCLKAFGAETFCECLTKTLAVGLDFNGYIIAVTQTKEELKYSAMSKDDKALVENAIKTREACVK